MKKIVNLPLYCLLIILSAILSACSPLSSSNFIKTDGSEHYAECQSQQPDESQLAPVESEQDLEAELTALKKLGAWSDDSQVGMPREIIYDFPITMNRQVKFYLDLFRNKQKKYFKRWLARSSKYMPIIQRELKNAGLPQDLAYLAMIESGYNPSAYSHAHAAGLWQFIQGTGRNYGLRIDSWVDERRDPEKATKAAVAYLRALHERFNDWQLAVAAYNAGEGKIERAIKKYNSRDFWELASHNYLRLETKRYVPKLIAAIIIARNPEEHGFNNITYEQPLQYDLIKVPARTDLKAVAVSGSTTIKKIRELNNDLRRNLTPPSTVYTLKIPKGSHDLIAANLSRLHPVLSTGYKTHKVRRGDTISRISKCYRISMTTLLKANNLHSSKLKIGQHLRIPYRTTKYVLLKKGESAKEYYTAASGKGQMILHELQQGETLSDVSKRYNVPVALLIQWNDIDDVRRIRAGQQLALYLNQDFSSAETASRATSAETTIISLADSKKRHPDSFGRQYQNIATVSYYRVRNGDSLWSIARKFRVSTLEIKRWNGLNNNMIHPGTRLVIKKS